MISNCYPRGAESINLLSRVDLRGWVSNVYIDAMNEALSLGSERHEHQDWVDNMGQGGISSHACTCETWCTFFIWRERQKRT
ncbi:hypothetical protein SEA_SIXAMA_197 [Gordonia phage Sixama]|uniref:Uncharacterized protein n=1 Tax=Gordonia phage Sixama TaxID=2653271 RepID=A0A5Q2F4C3_9CAUD|nr:hypothetical protein PP302_gp132 [Gordonia phage Sixama]QGF20347.1 hypothetical protein SEA_SIXAMA_197 [Gordonia phage Sixama]